MTKKVMVHLKLWLFFSNKST